MSGKAAKAQVDAKLLGALLDHAKQERMALVLSFDGEEWTTDMRGRSLPKRYHPQLNEVLSELLAAKESASDEQADASYDAKAMAELLALLPLDPDCDFWLRADFRKAKGRVFSVSACDYRYDKQVAGGCPVGRGLSTNGETAIAEAFGQVGWLES